jgi:single-stranded DNA-binding protein
MDMNVVVLCGSLAVPPELRTFESGSSLVRVLITVRSNAPRRRVDVVPVTMWNPDADDPLLTAAAGTRVFAVCSVQRRFWTAEQGRQSRLEIVARHLEIEEHAESVAGVPATVSAEST